MSAAVGAEIRLRPVSAPLDTGLQRISTEVGA